MEVITKEEMEVRWALLLRKDSNVKGNNFRLALAASLKDIAFNCVHPLVGTQLIRMVELISSQANFIGTDELAFMSRDSLEEIRQRAMKNIARQLDVELKDAE